MITIYPTPSSANTDSTPVFFDELRETIGLNMTPFSCGRAAMLYGLRALGLGRMDHILVPPFLGHCVLSTVSKTAFPTMTPVSAVKAILVYHQFGYPQKIDAIEKTAQYNGWIILNDCANTFLTLYRQKSVVDWGDFSVLSFSKIYPCVLGGALTSRNDRLLNRIKGDYTFMAERHTARANMAYSVMDKASKGLLGDDTGFEVDAVYGYLPEVVAFPIEAFRALPDTRQEIKKDANHRKRLLAIVTSYFPERVPECSECEVIPFAIPIASDPSQMESISERIQRQMDVEVPILHFDFARNMLEPDYRKALVIGCHVGWNEDMVTSICEIMRESMP
ncbi:MAG: hypothetical protein HOC20_09435 [Chloroflexi bacterium]|jgi:hypothetical protein|nr:hypothetical protein [Chloroflexota bacterium]